MVAAIERVGELTPQVVRDAVVQLADMMLRAGVTTYQVLPPEPRTCSKGHAGYAFRADEVAAAGVIAVKATRNELVEPATVEVSRLRQMLADAFDLYPNLDLDIEAMRKGQDR